MRSIEATLNFDTSVITFAVPKESDKWTVSTLALNDETICRLALIGLKTLCIDATIGKPPNELLDAITKRYIRLLDGRF